MHIFLLFFSHAQNFAFLNGSFFTKNFQKFFLEKSGRDKKSVIEGELSKIESAEKENRRLKLGNRTAMKLFSFILATGSLNNVTASEFTCQDSNPGKFSFFFVLNFSQENLKETVASKP